MLLQTLPLMLLVELLAAGIIGWLYRDGPASPLLLSLWLGAAVLLALWRLKLLIQFRRQLAEPHANTTLPLRRLLLMVTSGALRSEEHTSELQSLMRISYAVFCLKKKKLT